MLAKKKCLYCDSMFGDEVKGNCPNCGGNKWALVALQYIEDGIDNGNLHRANMDTKPPCELMTRGLGIDYVDTIDVTCLEDKIAKFIPQSYKALRF